jgi:hypothetical protein
MKRNDFLRKTILLAFAPVIGSANAILYAKPNDYGDIPIKGRWPYGNSGGSIQSIGNTLEVVATLVNTTLYITGAGCGSDVNVLIIGSSFTYQDTVSAADANTIIIDLSSALPGDYTLHLSNSLGGFLNGNFSL